VKIAEVNVACKIKNRRLPIWVLVGKIDNDQIFCLRQILKSTENALFI
jgi:hypothetical protein